MNTIEISTCVRCGHWNCDDCIRFKDGKEVKQKKEGKKSWVDVLFSVRKKGTRKGENRETSLTVEFKIYT